ncbi:hypothetical protein M2134_003170 [Parabacteroides sp. PM6-13]|nr:hypothetical protein [Parabacteroides sp. PM6-13]MDH6344269.1 hypothetical protein [Parabacteroides sp. PM6-13]
MYCRQGVDHLESERSVYGEGEVEANGEIN